MTSRRVRQLQIGQKLAVSGFRRQFRKECVTNGEHPRNPSAKASFECRQRRVPFAEPGQDQGNID